MEVYLDVIIIENTLIDLLLLLLTFKLTRVQYKVKSIYLSAIIGGLYTVVVFCDVKLLGSIPCNILMVIIMIYIAMSNKKISMTLKLTITYILLNFMLAGICFALVMMCNTYEVGGEFTITNYSIKYLILAAVVLGIVSVRVYDSIRERGSFESFIYDIYISEGEKTLLIKGLLDTGNALREPSTNLPCIIIENEYMKTFSIHEKNKFIINYNTISGNDVIYGFKSSNIRIRNDKSENWISVQAIVCGCENKLSTENEFHALLSRGVI